jgi:hypothetical protein
MYEIATIKNNGNRCPTLNSVVCRHSKMSGHTVNYYTKVESKKLINTRTTKSHIVSKNYSLTTVRKKSSVIDNNLLYGSAFLVLSDDIGDDDMVTAPSSPKKDLPVSYTSFLRKMPHLNIILPSRDTSLIPDNFNFSRNIITLDKITKRWADEEDDIDDCDILYMTNIPPLPFDTNHPLINFVAFIDVLARNYTHNFSKSIAITRDAFQQLSKNWEANFFDSGGGPNALDKSLTTNARARYLIIMERYIQ